MTRREMLARCAMGFGGLAFTAMAAESGLAKTIQEPWAVRKPHFAPQARSVIFLYMDGGPSQVDTFDYKPMLAKVHGRSPYEVMDRVAPTQFNNIGKVMQSPWKFKQYGESGQWVSDLFPCIAKVVDKLCFIHSMTSKFSEHTSANYFLHSGSGLQGRPSMGAWVGYGLGSECRDLPGLIRHCPLSTGSSCSTGR